MSRVEKSRPDRRLPDPRPWPRRYGWVIGGLFGVLAATGTAAWAWDREYERQESEWAAGVDAFERVEDVPAPPDVVQELIDQGTRVAVARSLEDRVGAAVWSQAEEVVADAPVTTRIGYLPGPTTNNGYTKSGAPATWAAAINEPGHYIVIYDDGTADVASVGYEEPFLFDVETRGQPGPALLRMAEQAVTWESKELRLSPMSDHDDWGGIGGGLAGVLLFGGFVVVPLFLGLRLLVSLLRKES